MKLKDIKVGHFYQTAKGVGMVETIRTPGSLYTIPKKGKGVAKGEVEHVTAEASIRMCIDKPKGNVLAGIHHFRPDEIQKEVPTPKGFAEVVKQSRKEGDKK